MSSCHHHPSRSRRRLRPGFRLRALALTCFVVLASPATGGAIAPALRERLERAKAGETIDCLISLHPGFDLTALDRALRLEHATRADRHRRVVETLRRDAEESQARLTEILRRGMETGRVDEYRSYWIANIIAARVRADLVPELASEIEVAFIEPNFQAVPLAGDEQPRGGDSPLAGGGGVPLGVRAVRADQVWRDYGLDGTSRLVCNFDSGVDVTHPALAARWRGATGAPGPVCWLDFGANPSEQPVDPWGHGTHVMGTMAGLGAATGDSIGVAPGSLWIAVNLLAVSGGPPSFSNHVLDALQWAADPDGNPASFDDVPDVVQNSWRVNEETPFYTDCDARWWSAIDNCEAAGVVVVYSAGNEGPGAGTVGSPADRATTALNAFSVGNVNASSFGWPYPIHFSSSRGPSGCVGPAALRIKPELVAPGVDVWSAVLEGGYAFATGTSMSGPHVAGVVALLRQLDPDLDVNEIKQLLLDTARDEGPIGDDNSYGSGFVDAHAAVTALAAGLGRFTGSVHNSSDGGSPIRGAKVRIESLQRTASTNASGVYILFAPAGVYELVASHPSFTSHTIGGASIVGSGTTVVDFALADTSAPAITGLTYPDHVPAGTTTAAISCHVADLSSIAVVAMHFRSDLGGWQAQTLAFAGGGLYETTVQTGGTQTTLEFYLTASDQPGNQAQEPVGAPGDLLRIDISYFDDDVESDLGWDLDEPGDALEGAWTRVDPYGSLYDGELFEPASDHSSDPGALCFVTGQGIYQPTDPSYRDVDGGCVTLISPLIETSESPLGMQLEYWRWFGLIDSLEGSFAAWISDNDGGNWVELESLSADARGWTQAAFSLLEFVDLVNPIRLRVQVCDTGAESLVEGALDDVLLRGRPQERGIGRIEGQITVATGGAPLEEARVSLLEIARSYTTASDGSFSGKAPAGTYTAQVSHPSCATANLANVQVVDGQTTTMSLALADVVSPVLSDLDYTWSLAPSDTVLVVSVSVFDVSPIALGEVVYRIDYGPWQTALFSLQEGETWRCVAPVPSAFADGQFYVHFQDAAGNVSTDPPDAPAALYPFVRVPAHVIWLDDAEFDRGWSLSESYDTAEGRWARMDPWGSFGGGHWVEPPDDYSSGTGVNCFVTGAGFEGIDPNEGDVDEGCVSLTTPLLHLAGVDSAWVNFARWFRLDGHPSGSFKVLATGDGGAHWFQVMAWTAGTTSAWIAESLPLTGIIPLTDQVLIRFLTCDNSLDSIVEGAVDDISITTNLAPTGLAEPAESLSWTTALEAAAPNPFRDRAVLRFRLAEAGAVRLNVYDAAGRRIRAIQEGPLPAGEHRYVWDGRDAHGRQVAAGVYFYALENANARRMERKLVLQR